MNGYPSNVPELIDAITGAWVELNTTLDAVNEDATTTADANGWTATDHVVNLIAWERSILYLLQHRPRYEGLGVSRELYLSDDVDAINEAIRVTNTGRGWHSVRAELEDNHAAFMSLINGLSWEELQLPYSHYLPDEPGDDNGDPILYWVYGNTVRHFGEHGGWIEELVSTGQ